MKKSEKALERRWCLSFDFSEKLDFACALKVTHTFQVGEEHKQGELHQCNEVSQKSMPLMLASLSPVVLALCQSKLWIKIAVA